MTVDVERMQEAFRQGAARPDLDLGADPRPRHAGRGAERSTARARLRFPDDLWARVVYDFALGHHYAVVHRDHLLRSLVPLYLGRTAAFVLATPTAPARPRARRSSTRVARGVRATEALSRGTLAVSDRRRHARRQGPAPHRRHRERHARPWTAAAIPSSARWAARVEVAADIFKEGHDVLVAFLQATGARTSRPGARRRCASSTTTGGRASSRSTTTRATVYTIEALADPFRSWLADLDKRVDAGQDVASELREGAALVRAAAGRATGDDADDAAGRVRGGWSRRRARPRRWPPRGDARWPRSWTATSTATDATWAEREYEVIVDRERARFAAWYEFFPRSGVARAARARSATPRPSSSARPPWASTSCTCRPSTRSAARIARARNNALTAQPGEPGSPWAIGGAEGGHDAVHPDLGTLADFDRFVSRARRLGLEVALDFAIQCSPDHP